MDRVPIAGMSSSSASPRRALLSVALLACFVLAVALACKKKKEASPATIARAAELKPKVSLVLTQVAGLTAKIKAADAPGAPAITPGPKPTFGTVTVLGEKFLEKPNLTGEELDLSDPVLAVCKYIVDSTQVKDEDIKSLEACARFEYAAVIRQTSYSQPDADDGRTYTPGRFSGNILLFHLATGEVRGRHSLDVSQSDQLELTTKSGQKPAAHEWRQQAVAYLQRHIRTEAQKKLQQ